ncbi:unnamed protein product, partial [Meganyctiphanes norvegica]
LCSVFDTATPQQHYQLPVTCVHIDSTVSMGLVSHLVVMSMAVLVVGGAPQFGYYGTPGCDYSFMPWFCPTSSTTRAPTGRYCDTWCEHPRGSGQYKCCDQVPDTMPDTNNSQDMLNDFTTCE